MGIFDPFKNLGEAFRLADRDGDGRSVGEWFTSLNMETFLWLAGMVIAAFFAATMLLGEIKVALCTHETYVMESASYNRDKKTVSIQCESCKKRLTYDAQIEVTETPASCNVEGQYNEWWTLEEVPGLGKLFTTTLPRIPHAIGEVTEAGYAPTCERDGAEDTGVCVMCYRTVGGESIPALGHDYHTQGYVAPTCTTTGLSGIEICERCGDTKGKDAVIPMTEHHGVAGTFAPTYRVCGFTGTACADCGFPVSIDEVHSPALVYDYFDLLPTDDGAGLIVTSVKCPEASMVIPDHVDDVPVLYLAEGLFSDNTELTDITLSKNLLEISNRAFAGCTSLKSITIPDSATHVGDAAFKDCSHLLFVDLGDGVVTVSSDAFTGCYRILSLKYPADFNLQENDFNHARKIPVLYAPKTIWYYIYYRREWANLSPDHMYFYNSTDEPTHIYEEDGCYFYNDGRHKVLLYCEDTCIKDGILYVPEGTNILAEDFLYRVRNVDGIVADRTLYSFEDQKWIKDEWESENYNELTVYYLGTEDEAEFIDWGALEASDSNYVYYYTRIYGAEYRGWGFDENGKPIATDEY